MRFELDAAAGYPDEPAAVFFRFSRYSGVFQLPEAIS
jgi:hypothetical protein